MFFAYFSFPVTVWINQVLCGFIFYLLYQHFIQYLLCYLLGTVLKNVKYIFNLSKYTFKIIRIHYEQQSTSIYPVSSLCLFKVLQLLLHMVQNTQRFVSQARTHPSPVPMLLMSEANRSDLELYSIRASLQFQFTITTKY